MRLSKPVIPAICFCLVVLSACATTSGPPTLPYPAFVQTDELPDIFMAALPGIRAKEYRSDMRTRTTSNRIDIPADWSGTTGGSPGKSLEIFVLAGELKFSDFTLKAGGYAYVPPGSLGFSLETDAGAQILYSLEDLDEGAVIRSPLILDSGLLEWQQIQAGVSVRELRHDPGSGSKTWLLRVEPGARQAFTESSAMREGYLVSGQYQNSECLQGEPQTWEYLPGGYFRRPPGAVNGGPEAIAIQTSVWFLRELSHGVETTVPTCPLEPVTTGSLQVINPAATQHFQ